MSAGSVIALTRRDSKTKRAEANPRYHVLSLRVSEDEKKELRQLLTPECPSMSDLMRQALELWKAELDARPTP